MAPNGYSLYRKWQAACSVLFSRHPASPRRRFSHDRIDAVADEAECQRLAEGLPEGRAPFFAVAARELGIDFEVEGQENIPREGAVVVGSNHPYGTPDSIILCTTLEQVRPDFKIFADNWFFPFYPKVAQCLADRIIAVDRANARANVREFGRGVSHLDQDGCVAIFPSGRMSRPVGLDGEMAEYPWREGLVKLMLKSTKPVAFQPVYFVKRSPLFTHLGLHVAHGLEATGRLSEIGRKLKHALSQREAFNMREPIRVVIGSAHSIDALLDQAGLTREQAVKDQVARQKLVKTMHDLCTQLGATAPGKPQSLTPRAARQARAPS